MTTSTLRHSLALAVLATALACGSDNKDSASVEVRLSPHPAPRELGEKVEAPAKVLEPSIPEPLVPVITVTNSEISYQGQPVASTESVLRDDSPTAEIDVLRERLETARKAIEDPVDRGRSIKDLAKACEEAMQLRQAPDRSCPDGLVILQADETTNVRVINKIVRTVKTAGFDQIWFAKT